MSAVYLYKIDFVENLVIGVQSLFLHIFRAPH